MGQRKAGTRQADRRRDELVAALHDSLGELADLSQRPGDGLLEMTIDELGLDSLEMLELVFRLESRFDMRLDLRALAKLTRLAELLDLMLCQIPGEQQQAPVSNDKQTEHG